MKKLLLLNLITEVMSTGSLPFCHLCNKSTRQWSCTKLMAVFKLTLKKVYIFQHSSHNQLLTSLGIRTCFETRTAILYLGSISGTRTIDFNALNIFDILKKSSSISPRGHIAGSKVNSL